MPSKQWKRSLLISGVLAFTIIFAFAPRSSGYGLSFSAAQTISAGTTNDYWLGNENYVYYQISCSMGSTLKVTLSFSSPNAVWENFEVTLYAPNQNHQAQGSMGLTQVQSTTASASTTCRMNGYYYIRLWNYSGGFPCDIALNVQNTAIPGFEPWLVLFSIVAAIGIIACLARRKYRMV